MWWSSLSLWQDESSSSDDDEDDEDWGSDTVDSGSESSDDGEGKSASLAMVFLKKWVSLSKFLFLVYNREYLWILGFDHLSDKISYLVASLRLWDFMEIQ